MTSPIPQTKGDAVRHALQATGWVLQAIDAPKDLRYWPRRDRDAWIEVVGRPRIEAIMSALREGQREGADETEEAIDDA